MLHKATILGLAAAASASFVNPAHVAANLVARQTDGSDATACISALAELITLIPTPPPEIIEWALSNTAVTDPCSVSIPDSIAPAVSSYQSVAISFLSAESAKISSIASVCPDASSVLGAIDQVTLTCDAGASASKTGSTEATPTGGSATKSGSGSQTTGTGTGTGTAAGGSGSSSTQTAGGARETGFVGAAIAAVGFLGVVAAL
ncbi:hypothetical protein QBC34DRAFT_379946 [Podospora aff. communis PSN243]|uniref:Infection structure specific protein n=1 Tax=Podospora aff. communis PSN243 TaxID=3040156 RepID=A0AAV9GQY6_9PEZI|nr:hypothetical protein QBC34DRAFT_379946 [Podospora aff. communis PSN243]